MAQFFRIFLSCVFIIFVVYGVLSLRIYRVSGDSMLPNLADGQYVLTDKLSQIIFPFSRGEIVVYHDGDGNDTLRVKRLIGLPQENIKIAQGKIFLMTENEKPIDEPYLSNHISTCIPGACTDLSPHLFSIPDGAYFILGDNRGVSRDSRGCESVSDCTKGNPNYIPKREIRGRVLLNW